MDLLETGVVRLDPAGRIRGMNSAAEQSLLIGRDRARGQPLARVAELPPELGAALAQISEDRTGFRLHELKLGTSLFDCTIQWLDGGDVLLELHDLEWEQMRLRLQQRELQIGMLALLSRNLGHEVRNPLGGIRGAAQLLADELGDGEHWTLARLIMRESDRIDELIQRFGQPELDRREVDLYPLVDEALALLAAEFGDRVRVDRDFDPSIPAIFADAAAIRQIILNLLRNAYQANASTLVVRTRVEHGAVLPHSGHGSVIRLDIIDDGAGVPESLRSLLFLPLVTGRRDGTGLGLSLSQQIASAHGGLLTFDARESGSRFSLYLPFGCSAAAHGAERA
ncbi:MAG: ATP-binding protein [Xanthomonadales bacterium]|nr:ATP-binding protein [Xanthomonadales bacterium]